MQTIPFEAIVEAACQLCLDTHFLLPDDLRFALEQAKANETMPVQHYVDLLLQNADVAAREFLPLSNDIGIPYFFVERGEEVILDERTLNEALEEGAKRAFHEYPFQVQRLLEPLDAGSLCLEHATPLIHLESVPGDDLKIVCLRLSEESERCTQLQLLSSPCQKEAIADMVIRSVNSASLTLDPPYVIGIGIGAGFERAGLMARKALFRPVGKPHPSLDYARLEEEVLSKVNALGIGPGNLGGKTTALAVHLSVDSTQGSVSPVALIIQNYQLRIQQIVL